jgi:branched-chain amino acid transport system substrate-binding protein
MKPAMRRRLPYLMIAAAVTAVVVAWWRTREPPPLRLGCITSLTGKYAAAGDSARDGARLAVEAYQSGGGRAIELVVMDDGGEPSRAASAAETLAAQGVRIIVGPYTTSSATAMLPVIDRTGQLAVGPTVAGDTLSGRDDRFIKLYPTSTEMGAFLGRAALARGCGRLVCIGDQGNEDFRRTVLDGARGVPGITLAAEVSFVGNAGPDHAALAARALAAAPQALLVIAGALDAALLCQQVRRLDRTVLLLAPPWAIAPELIEHGGSAVEGLLFPQPFDLDGRQPRWLAFAASFRERFGLAPTHVAGLYYEAVTLLAPALAAVGDDPQAVKRAVLTPAAHQGLQEDYAIDATGDARRGLVLHRVERGAFRRCEQPQAAGGRSPGTNTTPWAIGPGAGEAGGPATGGTSRWE